MLAKLPLQTSIPVNDLERAKEFYTTKLGLTPVGERGGGLAYECAGSVFVLVPTNDFGGASQYSLMTWVTNNIEASMSALQARGVIFEDYDLPFLKTVAGIATLGNDKIAWFKDSEGNILALAQLG